MISRTPTRPTRQICGVFLTIASVTAMAAQNRSVSESYGLIPLAFEGNQGQTDSRVEFLARLGGSMLFLTHEEAVIASPGKEPLRLRFHGANLNARIVSSDQQGGNSNYFVGNDPSKWRRNVPQFSRVKYRDLYPGIDLIFYGNRRNLEFDFVIAPGADPGIIALDVLGFAPALDRDGGLVAGDARFHKPVVYQIADDSRHAIDARYKLLSGRQVRFHIGNYDRSLSLVIDPVLVYSTYLGGSNQDIGGGVAVDSSGGAYVTGYVESTDFPVTPGAYQKSLNGPTDIFVTKFSPTGNSLIYSTYLGGSEQEWSSDATGYGLHRGVAVDSSGNAYVVGDTASTDFPMTSGAYQNVCAAWLNGSCFTAFFSKLSADGSQLLYSTYLGGSSGEEVIGVAVDSTGHAYLAGETSSNDFPTTPGSFYSSIPAYCQSVGGDRWTGGFLSKLDPTASGSPSLVYSTYILSYYAPTGAECAPSMSALTLDASGRPFIAGRWVVSAGSPPAPASTGFAAEFDLSQPGVGALIGSYSFGYTAYPYAIAADNSGNSYVTGTVRGCFGLNQDICVVNGFQPTLSGTQDAFVAKQNLTGGSGGYLSYLGGNGSNQVGNGIAIDSAGNAYVTGYTDAADFPLLRPIQAGPVNSTFFAFLTKVNPTGQALSYSTFFGDETTVPVGVALDTSGNAYLSGYVSGSGLPVIEWFQGAPGNTSETTFMAKISPANLPGVAFIPGTLTFPSVYVGTPFPQTATLLAAGSQGLNINSIVPTGDYAVTSNCPSALSGGAMCSLTVTFTPTVGGDRPGTVTISDNAAGSPHALLLDGTGIPTTAAVTPTSLQFPGEPIGASSVPKYVKITNTGQGTLTVYSAVASLADYAVSNLCPPSLAPSASCYAKVIFTPSAAGPRNGTLTISDNAAVSSVIVTLTGDGPDFNISNSPISGTVSAGHATASTVTLTPKNTLTGPVALTCTVPAGVGLHCSMNPASVTLNGTNSATATLTVRSSASTPAGTYRIYSTGNFGGGAVKHSAMYTSTVQ